MSKFLFKILCCFIPSKKIRANLRGYIKKNKDCICIKVVPNNLPAKTKNVFNNRILLITQTNFLTKNAGNNTYIFAIVELLKNIGFEIDFLSSTKFLNDFENFQELNNKYNLIDKLFLCNKDNLTFSKYKYSDNSWVDDEIMGLFQKITSENQYSYILSNYINFSDLFRFSKIDRNTRIVNIMHDCDSMQQFFTNSSIDKYDKIGKNFENEIKLLQYYDDILCISNDEKYIFEKFYKNKNFYWLPHFTKSKELANKNKDIDCLFLGHSNIYNLNSIIWFFNNVFNRMSNCNLTICGNVSEMLKRKNPELYNLMQKNGVNFINFVEDLDALYARAKIAIVPMIDGTGLKIKTVTAMSYGLPIVGTEAAVDGFADKNENGCLTTNNPDKFIKYINRLLVDDDYYQEQSNKIKKYFQKKFSVDVNRKTLESIFVNLNKQ